MNRLTMLMVLMHQGESNAGDPEWATKVQSVYDHLLGYQVSPGTHHE